MTDLHIARVFATPIRGVFATYSSGGRQFEKHWHDTYTFGLLDEGAQNWLSARGRVDAYAGDVINTNPGEVHDGRPLGGPSRSWRMVSIDAAVFAKLVDCDGTGPEIVRPVIRDPQLDATLRRLFEIIASARWCKDNPVEALAFEEGLVEACMGLMVRHGSVHVDQPEEGGNVRIIREWLADSPSSAPSLTAMAATIGLSKFQLLRRFKAAYGLPPHAWLQCQRAERARQLIRSGAALPDAAQMTGFADQSHMTRAFRRLYGYTPGVWRRALMGSQVSNAR